MSRKVLETVVLAAVIIGGSVPATSIELESEAAAVLDTFHRAAAEADGETYFGLFTPAAVFIGTDATERWTIPEFKAFAEPYFSRGRGWLYELESRHLKLSADGETVWFDELLHNESYGLCRGTGVLERIEGSWKISQYHLTIPMPNELAGELTARIKAWSTGAPDEPSCQPLTVVLVRHAEKLDGGPDPLLSAAGLARAELLAEQLRSVGITAVHSTDFARTRDTARPLAERLGLELELYDPARFEDLVRDLCQRGGRHLVVGHSDTTPALVRLLGGDPGDPIDEATEYDRLYLLTGLPTGNVTTTVLRYGSP